MDQLETQITAILRNLLLIEDDITIDPNSDLVRQVGLDSIEAFDAVATIHEIIGKSIPNDFNPKISNSIHLLAQYVINQFGDSGVQKILEIDPASLRDQSQQDSI